MESFNSIIKRESGLPQGISRQAWFWMAVGGGISGGLIQGGQLVRFMAGPWLWLCYALAAGFMVLLVLELRAVIRLGAPVSGFAAYIEARLGSYAGYAARVTYCCAFILIVGSEIGVLGSYLSQVWGGPVSVSMGVLFFGLVWIQASGIRIFSRLALFFSYFKLLIFIGFVAVACYVAWVIQPYQQPPELSWPTEDWSLAALGSVLLMALFSFQGVEMLSLSAAQAQEPPATRAARLFRGGLSMIVIYMLVLLASVWLVPWQVSTTQPSPLVVLMTMAQVPYMKEIFYFVVVLFGAGVLNAQLYVAARLLFSLSRAGHLPAALAAQDARGTPVRAVALATLLVALVAGLVWLWPLRMGAVILGVAGNGVLLCWLLLFAARALPQTWHEEGYWAGARACLGVLILMPALLLMPFSDLHDATSYFGWLFQVIICFIYLAGSFYVSRKLRFGRYKNSLI